MPIKKVPKHNAGHPGKSHIWGQWYDIPGNMKRRDCVRELSYCKQFQTRER